MSPGQVYIFFRGKCVSAIELYSSFTTYKKKTRPEAKNPPNAPILEAKMDIKKAWIRKG